MQVTPGDIADRLSILLLKMRVDIGSPALEAEAADYLADFVELKNHPHAFIDLFRTNAMIWDLEADIRRGKEGELTLEEIGRRTLKIRDLNKQRIDLKNQINAVNGVGYQEKKIDHASAS